MPTHRLRVLVYMLPLLFASAIHGDGSPLAVSPGVGSQAYNDHWHQGKAEITSYHLEQARYGEVRRGDAVAIFVTEDFSRERHVKLDNPAAAGDDRVGILKLNLTKTFNTGVYPYSMMTSVFTPTDTSEGTLKVTTSSQEWCGHTFTQLNRKGAGYHFEERSYFESEGDVNVDLDTSLTEDGLWTLMRLAPSVLPVGDVELLPGTMYLRLSHAKPTPRRAKASLTADPSKPRLMVYRLEYPDLRRTLSVHIQRDFPHAIESWEETYPSRGQMLTTRATLNKRIFLDYWGRNSLADEALRDTLGLR